MAKIIQLPYQPSAHFSYERRGGYTLVTPDIIRELFKLMRGGTGPDAFLIKSYITDEQNITRDLEIMRGCVPTEAYDKQQVLQHQRELEKELDDSATTAIEQIKNRVSRNYESRNHGNDIVFVKSDHGVIGCGWYDSAHTLKKGIKMAEFMLYALGSLNASNDRTLYSAVYNYLPYEGQITISEANRAEAIITKCLGERRISES